MRQTLGSLVGLVICALISGGANAIVINTLNSPATFLITQDQGGGGVFSASGSVTVTSGFNSSSLVLHVILNNTSSQNGTPYAVADNVRLTGWGFGVDPDATGVTFSDVADGGVIDAMMDNFPNLAAIEVCAWGGNSCSGGGNGGIQASNSDTFDLVLAGHWGTSVTFDPISALFQTSSRLAATAVAVPEPQTLLLLGIGLIALAVVGRNRTFNNPSG